MSKHDFEKSLLDAVDESLSSLGESSKQAIYYHLEKSFSINKQEIPDRVEEFINALERIFGPGANFIETLIIKRLDEKVEQIPKGLISKEATLTEYVTAIKNSQEKMESGKIQVGMTRCGQISVES